MLGVGHRCSLILRNDRTELRWGRLGRRDSQEGPTIGRSIAFARDRSSDITRFADSVGVLARGARILVPSTHKDGAVGIKATPLRPAAASGSPCYPTPRQDAPARARARTCRRNIASR